jgi:hypothetical protein
MSLVLRKNGNALMVVEGKIPESDEFLVFTEEEVRQFQGWQKWISLSTEQSDDMLFQTQSASYQDWMEEDDWDTQ